MSAVGRQQRLTGPIESVSSALDLKREEKGWTSLRTGGIAFFSRWGRSCDPGILNEKQLTNGAEKADILKSVSFPTQSHPSFPF